MPFPSQKGLGSQGGPRVVLGTRAQIREVRRSGNMAQLAEMSAAATSGSNAEALAQAQEAAADLVRNGADDTAPSTQLTTQQMSQLTQAEAAANADDEAGPPAKKAAAKKAAAKKTT